MNSKKPYQLFGPTPSLNNSFMIGSEEIFSKPLSFLNIQIDWNGLPKNFQKYYKEYNTNLDISDALESASKSLSDSQGSLSGETAIAVNLEIADINAQMKAKEESPFNNICFTSNFDVLQDNEWETLTTTKQSSCSFDNKLGRFVCKKDTDQKLQKTVIQFNDLFFVFV